MTSELNILIDRLTSLQSDMTASACDDNRRFVDGVVYGIEMAKASAWATLKAVEQEEAGICDRLAKLP